MDILGVWNCRPHRRLPMSAAMAAMALIVAACSGGSSKPPQPSQPTPSASAAPRPAASQPKPKPGPDADERPIPWATPEVKLTKSEAVFIPLSDQSGNRLNLSWEIRHYARAAMSALIAPSVS